MRKDFQHEEVLSELIEEACQLKDLNPESVKTIIRKRLREDEQTELLAYFVFFLADCLRT